MDSTLRYVSPDCALCLVFNYVQSLHKLTGRWKWWRRKEELRYISKIEHAFEFLYAEYQNEIFLQILLLINNANIT